ncbi:MAG: hypothetical protein LBB62_10010 [Proteiniphilum sp.]|jgi:hypothetical protein|nr:hypothetical protein [Proteiniphilum sp.]
MDRNLLKEVELMEMLAQSYHKKINDCDSACTEKVRNINQKWDAVVREKTDKANALTRYRSGCKQYIDGVHSLYAKKIGESLEEELRTLRYEFEKLNSGVFDAKYDAWRASEGVRNDERDSENKGFSKGFLVSWAEIGGVGKGLHTLTTALGYATGFGLLGYLGYCIFDVAGKTGVAAMQAGLSIAAFKEGTTSMAQDALAQFFSASWVLAATGLLLVTGVASLLLSRRRQKKMAEQTKQYAVTRKQEVYKSAQYKLASAKADVKAYMEKYPALFNAAYNESMFGDTLGDANGYFKTPADISSVIKLGNQRKSKLLTEAINGVPKNFDVSVYNPPYQFSYYTD